MPADMRRFLVRGLIALLFVPLASMGCGRGTSGPTGLAPAPEELRLRTLWNQLVEDVPFDRLLQDDSGGVTVAMDGALVVAALPSGRLVALDAQTGQVHWERETPYPWVAPPVADGRDLILAGSDGYLELARARDGETRWRRALGAPLTAPPLVTQGRVLIIDSRQRLHVLDRETGNTDWSFSGRRAPDLAIQALAVPLVANDAVYAGFGNGSLYRFSLDGDVRWARDLSGGERRLTDVLGQPVLHEGIVFAGTLSGGLFALDPETGATLWHRSEGVQAGPFAAGDAVVSLGESNELVWRDARTGQELIRQELPWSGISHMTPSGSFLLVPTYSSGLAILALDRPYLLARHTASQGFAGSLATEGDRVYVRSRTGRLHALQVGVRTP